jgi:hypothetical protein
MREIAPGTEKGVISSPAKVFSNPNNAALAAVCFWKVHFLDNKKNKSIVDMSHGKGEAEKVLRLMNSGKVNGQVRDRLTGRNTSRPVAENARRFEVFKSVRSAHEQCAQ